MTTKRKVFNSILRRVVEWTGVSSAAGLDNDLVQLAGAVGAALSLGWSIYEKVRDARDVKEARGKGGALAP